LNHRSKSLESTITPPVTSVTVFSATQLPLNSSTFATLKSSSSLSASTSTVATSSGGLTAGAIGGIVAGILGGFIILSGTVLFIFLRRPRSAPSTAPETVEGPEQQDDPDMEYVVVTVPQVSTLKYPEEMNQVGARTGAEFQGQNQDQVKTE
jgi:hypothetical protein